MLIKHFVKRIENNCIVGIAVPVVDRHNCSVVLACTCASNKENRCLSFTVQNDTHGQESQQCVVPADGASEVHVSYSSTQLM